MHDVVNVLIVSSTDAVVAAIPSWPFGLCISQAGA
jgi:hypothetical protein